MKDKMELYRPVIELPPDVTPGNIGLLVYQRAVSLTDRMPPTGLELPILGLFGEVGGLLSELKKKQRDLETYEKYHSAVLEELGDTLWYFTNIVARAGLDLSILAQRMTRVIDNWDQVERHGIGTFGDIQVKHERPALSDSEFSQCLIELAGRVGDLVNDFKANQFSNNRDALSAHLVEILRAIVLAANAVNVSLDAAAHENLRKTFSRWPLKECYAPRIDADMPENERLPRQFTVRFEEMNVNGKLFVLQKCNGIIIGDRLTDNKTEKDDYRFHDVFHMANATYLGWSPVLRALFHLKRKSNPDIDENQDGARAILIEEGVSTFIFGRGLVQNLFADTDRVDYDLLKSIQHFVQGYEIARCPLWQWEKAILNGFHVFRDLKKYRRGYVTADLDAHTLKFNIDPA